MDILSRHTLFIPIFNCLLSLICFSSSRKQTSSSEYLPELIRGCDSLAIEAQENQNYEEPEVDII